MTENEIGADMCPACREPLTRIQVVNVDAVPDPGDYIVCVSCATPLRVTDSRGLSLVPMAELKSNKELLRLVELVADVRVQTMKALIKDEAEENIN